MREVKLGDVVLIAFPFIAQGATRRKRRPAVVVQADRYNRRRAAVIIAAITSYTSPCKPALQGDGPQGQPVGANCRPQVRQCR